MAVQIQLRRGTAAEWAAANPILAEGEQGYEKDTGKLKVGDGATHWNALAYNLGIQGPLTYTYTGTLSSEPVAFLTDPVSLQIGNTLSEFSGVFATSLYLNANPSLTSIEFSNLSGIYQGLTISLANVGALTSLSFPTLKIVGVMTYQSGATFIGGLVIAGVALATINLPELVYVGLHTNVSNLAATTIDFPKLEYIGGYFSGTTLPNLTTVNLPSIKKINPATTQSNSILFYNATPALTSFTLGASLNEVGTNVQITSCALNQASVDNILVRLAALDGTNGTVAFSNRTVTITGTSSAPSATGLTAKSTLVARGCTVTHN